MVRCGGHREKRKTKTEMGRLREEICGNEREVENEGEGWGSGDGWWRRQRNGISDEEAGKKNRRPVSEPASPRTTLVKRYRCQPHPKL